NPERIVIDLKRTRMRMSLPKESVGFVERMRSAERNAADLRIVLDTNKSVKPKTFLLVPNKTYGHRLVIDLYDQSGNPSGKSKRLKPVKQIADNSLRDVVIAIDAGHGGEDPGALGRKGTREKDVVLAIARELKRKINAQRGMRAVLIRTGDYYIEHRRRMRIARQAKADLFISIHADAFKDRRAKGASVYVLSERGASSEAAKWLAQKENQSDLVGGVSLDDKDPLTRKVLLDLSQNATLEDSHSSAREVLRAMGKVTRLHKKEVQQAGFLVLKAPDIPSILIETAYISNPTGERNLRSKAYQRKLAAAIVAGLKRYFAQSPQPGTLLASVATTQRHTISRGETLSLIASRYQVSLKSLRVTNKLASDRIRIGQILVIPRGT
ncbi:MAG: N-acetylmuramoyl-L-alanine amidase, partial [Gammaproteobacteria bacterium]|nr:N-acetylmuramoyl-L-alanine amidase [Gammaproteobacteria bacterium]